MSMTHVVGVDPGLVHTGVVLMVFDQAQRVLEVDHEVVAGPDTTRVQQFLAGYRRTSHIFIEAYKPRSHFGTDSRMSAAVTEMRVATGGTVLQNTGVKKVIRRPLMELLGVWDFSTRTHHQDLRSAARIALLGMVKDQSLNRLLADFVHDQFQGRRWHVAN